MSASCPCGSGRGYDACCGGYHRGTPAPTAEALMRSRYSAFVLGDEAYLLETWHPSTRPARVGLDPRLRWTGLSIQRIIDGTPFHTSGTVRFTAGFESGGRAGALTETSHFVSEAGRWLYVDGVVE